ncbi:MAG: hypothetical protein Q7U88_12740 [Desulfocapsaceae bacterium]|nr:hypothetical protein [Desulfocapsaceae bacterium]
MRTHYFYSLVLIDVFDISGIAGLLFEFHAVAAVGEADQWDEISQRAQARLEEFFVLVNAQQADDALTIMHPQMVETDAQRQAWRSHLEAIRSVHVMDVEPVSVETWTFSCQKFKVTLEAYVVDTPAAPIPFYGWHDNPNIRWITMVLGENSGWQIHEIATGP